MIIRYPMEAYKGWAYTPSPCGEEEEDDYRINVDSAGRETVVKKEEKRLTQQKINAACADATIAAKVARYMRGDMTALQQTEGVFMDLTKLPNNIHQNEQAKKDLEQMFNRLDTDAKREFDYDFNTFKEQAINGSIENTIGKIIVNRRIANEQSEYAKQIRGNAANSSKSE